ncbi:MAG: flagella basal body P-ring formation protein FlgA [Candidatus Azotimanducaceae bacterium]|jgi:flagella basal body P-ring formation protein FlgA
MKITDKHLTHSILPTLLMTLVITLVTGVPLSSAMERQSIEAIRSAATNYARQLSQKNDVMVTKIDTGKLDERLKLTACGSPLEAFMPYNVPVSQRITVGVRCLDPKLWTIYVPVRIESEVPVLVLARSVRRGETLSRSNIRLERRTFIKTASPQIRQVSAALGLQATRSLPGGSVLTDAMLTLPSLVYRGDQVGLRIKMGLLTVHASAEALEDGVLGERIWLQNTQTRRKVEGTVQKDGTVTVISP